MYAGYVNGNLLFACGMPGYEIVDGTISEAVGSASSAEIKLPPSNSMRDAPTKRSSVISIHKDGTEVFRGCVVSTSAGLRGVRTYNLDGAMMWLADICKPPHTITSMEVSAYLGALVGQYNAGCLEHKQIKMGMVDVSLPAITFKVDTYMSMLDLAMKAASASGGILRIRYSGGDVYLDCIKAYDHRCSQTVELRRNLLDLTDQIDGTDLITRVYPVGKDGLTISYVNGGQAYLVNSEAERVYGRIDGTLQVDTDDAYVMKATAASYLAQHCGLSRGIQVSAADLSGADITMETYRIGDSVRVVSPPHGIDTIMTVSELKTSLVGAKGTMTLGWAGMTLTGAVALGVSRSASGTPVSGEVGTDNVIAQGTTGKWMWRKWASGIAEMWATFDTDKLTIGEAWGSIYFGTWMRLAVNVSARQYPFSFTEEPTVTASYMGGSGDAWLISLFSAADNLKTSAPAYALARPNQGTINAPRIAYYVIGKYK